MRKLTQSQVCSIVESLGFRLVSTYVDNKTHATFECAFGHTWDAIPANVMCGRRGCPHCSGRARLTVEEVNARLLERGSLIRLVGEYKSALKPCIFSCGHGHEWLARPNDILDGGYGCPHCFGNAKLSKKSVNSRLLDSGRDVLLVGEYKSALKRTTFKCSSGHEWVTTPDSVLRGHGCPSCAKRGFDPDKPAYLYVLEIYNSTDKYLGFGITGALNRRLRDHRKNIELCGFAMSNPTLYEFRLGSDAQALESKIKKTVTCAYLDIDGFRTESVTSDHIPTVMSLIHANAARHTNQTTNA